MAEGRWVYLSALAELKILKPIRIVCNRTNIATTGNHYGIPKRRKAVLVDDIAKDCRELIEEKCAAKGWKILELAVQRDHVHLFVRPFPDNSPSEIVKECKGITFLLSTQEIPFCFEKITLSWTRSYFVATAGNVSAETIKNREAQKGL
ncbi:MAG: IS200/IS605 family transposase [Chloroflexi bacterium]|nr:IS200/IS605 family transposase [Chloroflexota bacterium]